MGIKDLLKGIMYLIIWGVCLYIVGVIFGGFASLIFFIISLLWMTEKVQKKKAEKTNPVSKQNKQSRWYEMIHSQLLLMIIAGMWVYGLYIAGSPYSPVAGLYSAITVLLTLLVGILRRLVKKQPVPQPVRKTKRK